MYWHVNDIWLLQDKTLFVYLFDPLPRAKTRVKAGTKLLPVSERLFTHDTLLKMIT